MKKLKKIWKRVGAIFALALVMIPVLVIGASAGTIYDGIERPAEGAGGLLLDVTYEEAAVIMQGMTYGDRYVSEFYGQIHTFSEDLRACDYPAVAFTDGAEDIDGDAVVAVSNDFCGIGRIRTNCLTQGMAKPHGNLCSRIRIAAIRKGYMVKVNVSLRCVPRRYRGTRI